MVAVVKNRYRRGAQLSPVPVVERPWTFTPGFLSAEQADRWLEISKQVSWQHNQIKMFGKPLALPRLEAIIGDGDYSYSGLTLKAQPWTDDFLVLKDLVEKQSGSDFQIMIGNQYRDGSDHIGWHSDDSPEMGTRPAIASLSLGATRKFQLRHKQTREIHAFELTHGSLFLMHAGCQEEYQHRLCKASGDTGLRINWTFRPLVGTSKPQRKQLELVSLPPDPLPALASQINRLYEEAEQAQTIALSASKSALEHAKRCGELLLEAKAQIQHGGWEKWRNENLSIPSSTAAQYQRIAENWAILEGEEGISSISAANEHLKRLKAATKSAEPAVLPAPIELSDIAAPVYEYSPIDPTPCWFAPNGEDFVEAKAIAKNPAGNVRLRWGDNHEAESSVPAQRIKWSQPETVVRTAPAPTPELEDALYEQLAQVSQAAADGIYLDLCKLKTDADQSQIAEIAEEINDAILAILEFHFLEGDQPK